MYSRVRDEERCHSLRMGWNYHDQDETFEKVIFLDVDGVLNDEGERRNQGFYIEDSAMDALGRIVRETGAELVLSSSWRWYWSKYESEGFEEAPEPYKMFKRKLDKRGLRIAAYTPATETGPATRPAEIRTWLLDKQNVTSFVILDDDTFWMWGWLTPFFVMTQTETGEEDSFCYKKRVRGLTEAHAEEAIRILNGNDYLSPQERDQVESKREYERRMGLAKEFCKEHRDAVSRAHRATWDEGKHRYNWEEIINRLADEGYEGLEFTWCILLHLFQEDPSILR